MQQTLNWMPMKSQSKSHIAGYCEGKSQNFCSVEHLKIMNKYSVLHSFAQDASEGGPAKLVIFVVTIESTLLLQGCSPHKCDRVCH